jgi:RHS repeat-associated protein
MRPILSIRKLRGRPGSNTSLSHGVNELTNATRSGTLTVAGVASQPGANISSVSVSVNGGGGANADVYADGSWALSGTALNNGANAYAAIATDTFGRTASDTISLSLPSTNNFSYDHNGSPGEIMRLGWQPDTNSLLPVIMVPKARTLSHREILTNDGRRVFEYDYENQLTNVYVAAEWRSEFKYDAFGRRRVRKEYTWSSAIGNWQLTNEVRYVYDVMLVVQERDANNLAMVSYTRGNDLSGTLQGAGGIGGLLARTDMPSTINPQPSASPHSYYHCDGNGNITALVDTNGILVAKYNYDPYGNLLGMSGPLAEANTYRFSSKEYAGNAGLYYYGYRYYEPNLQRWLNRDPIGQAGGINLYVFVGNNGMFWIDAYGLHWTDYIPDILVDPGTVNFVAGMGDNLSFSLTRRIRDANEDFYGSVDKCSDAYRAGDKVGTALSLSTGVGRAAYAGLAKAGSIYYKAQGVTRESALAANAFRNGLKYAFNAGIKQFANPKSVEAMTKKYGTDWAKWIAASGRTATETRLFGIPGAFNGVGAYFLGNGVANKIDPLGPCENE